MKADADGFLSPEDTARITRSEDNYRKGVVTLEDAQTFIDQRRMWPQMYPMVDRMNQEKVRDWLIKRGSECNWSAFAIKHDELEALCDAAGATSK